MDEQGTHYTPFFGVGAAILGYVHVLWRRGLFVRLSDAVKDEIIREVTFYGILGVIAGAILDYA